MSKYKIFYGGALSILKPEHEIFLDNIGIDKSNSFSSSNKTLIYYNDNIVVKIFFPSTDIKNEISSISRINEEDILVNEVLAYNHKLNLIIYPKYNEIPDIFNLDLIEFIFFIESILRILDFIHYQDFIHQDVSIHNIKLKKDGKYILIDTEGLVKSSDIEKKLYDVKMFIDESIKVQFNIKLRKLKEGGLIDTDPKIILLNNHIKILQIIISKINEESIKVIREEITLFEYYGIILDLLGDFKKLYRESNSYQPIFDKYIIES